jgi:hypothetical protein
MAFVSVAEDHTDIAEDQYLVTATAAGRVLGGLSAAAVVALANRGKLHCVRDSSNRRMFSVKDLTTLRKQRQAARRSKGGRDARQ